MMTFYQPIQVRTLEWSQGLHAIIATDSPACVCVCACACEHVCVCACEDVCVCICEDVCVVVGMCLLVSV